MGAPERSKTRDTGAARLPGLPRVATGNAQLDAWITAATEHLEVRAGSRGNDAERAVTQRQLQQYSGALEALQAATASSAEVPPGLGIEISVGGLAATMAIKKFEDAIKATRLYQDLKKRLDDHSRFDDLRAEVREELLRDLAELARKQGAAVQRIERIIEDTNLSIAMKINTVTASAADAAAGVRQLAFATAEQGRAQAGQITQLQASLDNYYADGQAGVARLEQQMTVTADRVDGLSGQYTLKIMAGGALAGFGLAATEKDGVPDSAFIIAANKFAIVNPATWSGGLTNTPDAAHIPFGVDANGIYMNSNVYVKGAMRVDTGGKTLLDGLRGSLDVNGGSGNWSDTVARQAIWRVLGKSGSATNNNHLVIGDCVTIGSTTKQWMGSYWDVPGIVINGSMLVNGSVAAQKIDTRGLTIKDDAGNVIFGAGQNLDASRILGLGSLAMQSSASVSQVTGLGTLATRDNVETWQVNGLGGLAVHDTVNISLDTAHSQVTIAGQKIAASDLVSRLSKINSSNISTFMENAAIGSAYIGNAVVDTLHIAGEAISVPKYSKKAYVLAGIGWDGNDSSKWQTYDDYLFYMPHSGRVQIVANSFIASDGSGWDYAGTQLWVAGVKISTHAIDKGYYGSTHTCVIDVAQGANVRIELKFCGNPKMRCLESHMSIMGVMR